MGLLVDVDDIVEPKPVIINVLRAKEWDARIFVDQESPVSLPKSLPWGSLCALGDPITVMNRGALKAG